MGRVIAVANHKGGVGKTTSVACIGQALSRRGKRTLLIDLDAQANLTGFFLKEEDVEADIYDILTGAQQELPIKQVGERLYIIPSSLELARAETALSTRLARERILSEIIEQIAEDYDYILLDCPPSLGIITTNALVAATDLYIPLTAEALPLKGLKMLEEIVSQIQHSINKGLEISGVIITRYNNRKLNKVIEDAIRSKYGDRVFTTKIRENIAVAETPLYGGDLYGYAPDSNGAKDYDLLTDEIIKRNE